MTAHRLTSKGQVTIPKAMRDALGLRAASSVKFELVEGGILVSRDQTDALERGQRLVEHLRSHQGRMTMTTEELMALTRGEE